MLSRCNADSTCGGEDTYLRERMEEQVGLMVHPPLGYLSGLRWIQRKEEIGRSVSCRMYLVIVLFLFPQVLANVIFNYDGFNYCEIGGWRCNRMNPSEIEFSCLDKMEMKARLWVWTARLPDRVRKLTARDCKHLQLHVDCTRNYQSTKINDIELENIEELTILKPSDTYLHDNAPFPHLPPYVRMKNIGRINLLYEGLFGGEHSPCSYNSGVMKKMYMENVHIGKVEQGAFKIELEEVVWKNVTFDNIDEGAIVINGTSLTVEDSSLGDLKNKAIVFKSENVTFGGNRFTTIEPGALNVYSENFVFHHNKIKEIMSHGLVVSSTHVDITNNYIGELSKDALGAISPIYYVVESLMSPRSLTYNFTGNEIHYISRFSLHPNWKVYGEISCTKITVDGNKFNCDCLNLLWLNQFEEAGANAEFYRLLLNTTNHCGTNRNCSLSAIVPYVCKDKWTLPSQCNGFHENETFVDVNFNETESFTLSVNLEGDPEIEVNDSFQWKGTYSQNDDDSQMTLNKSYFTDKAGKESSGLGGYLWVMVIVVIVLCSFLLAGSFWYIKRKKRHNVVEIYKYDKTVDTDNLIAQPRIEPAAEFEIPFCPE